MSAVLTCLTTQHDWRMALLAVLVCVGGFGAGAALIEGTRGASRPGQTLRFAAAAVIGAMSVWSTHFIAMRAYDAGGEVGYDLGKTLASFAIIVVAMAAAGGIMALGRSLVWRLTGAVVAAAGVCAMHFLGMAAVLFPGHLGWDPNIVVASIGGAVGLAVVAGLIYGAGGLVRTSAATVVGALGVAFLHFVAMGAARFTPDPRVVLPETAMSDTAILTWISIAVAALVGAAVFLCVTAWWSRSNALLQVREAIDAMPDGLAFYDSHDRLVLWNARYAEVNPELSTTLTAGLTFREIIQLGLDEGLYAEAAGREEAWVAERMASRRQLSTMMEQHIAGDRWLRVSDRRTAAGGIVTVVNDITDLKRDARALAEARDAAEAANRAKSQFLANMSHEIRTPLNGVIGVAQALAKTRLDPTQREMLELIHSSGHTLQTLLSDILDLARVESGRLELAEDVFNLRRAVREAAQLYAATAREKGLQFYVEITPEAPEWIHGDVVRLKQILTNLVSNAVKFTANGFVSLTVSPGPRQNGGETLRFTVEDTGIGFDADARQRLFSRFEQADGAITRRFGGSGLGLAISRQLAAMMEGDLDCESEPDGGSAFILTIPLRLAEPPQAPAEEHALVSPGSDVRPVRVLLADDHPTNRKVVELILAQADIELTTVDDGAQALEAYRAGEFDLVLMDMQMPVMDGLTATQEIRLHEAALGGRRTPVVMLTANALSEHVAAASAAGADRHLAKPFNAAELLALIAELPEAARAAAA